VPGRAVTQNKHIKSQANTWLFNFILTFTYFASVKA